MGKELFLVQLEGKDQDFSFRHIEFKMPVRLPSGDIEHESGYITREFTRKSPSLASAQRSKLKSWDRMRSSRL